MSQQYEQAPPAPSEPRAGGPSGPRAGFWRRFAAYFMDLLLLFVVDLILRLIFKNGGLYIALSTIVNWGYFTYFEGGESGQTIGKRALGIRVYDFRQGGPIGYGRAFIRQLGRILASIPFFLGYFWMLWDKEKQCWQDKLAGDVVVPVDAYR
jgi:uncharacterized RDD family membrane protein YckC